MSLMWAQHCTGVDHKELARLDFHSAPGHPKARSAKSLSSSEPRNRIPIVPISIVIRIVIISVRTTLLSPTEKMCGHFLECLGQESMRTSPGRSSASRVVTILIRGFPKIMGRSRVPILRLIVFIVY